MKTAQELKDEYYYNGSGSIFSIKIAYITGPQSTELYAQSIDAALRLLGVKTELVPYDSKAVQTMIKEGSRPYDLLVIGISVDGSLSSIARIFATNESRNGGVNFASIENKTLDNLFTELSATTDRARIDTIENSITKLMNSESFFVPISSPYHRLWVDRNIEGIPSVNVIPDIASLVDVFAGTSIKKTYIRSTTDKTMRGWFEWLFSNI
jgi:ABC-type transport system substrate-binding protein